MSRNVNNINKFEFNYSTTIDATPTENDSL